MDDHDQRISSLELASEDLSQRVLDLENISSSLRDENAKLKAKVINLENRSRRQNVHILGLAESTESGRPTEFFSQLLQEVYGKETLPSLPKIDRAHRSLAPKPATGERGVTILISRHVPFESYNVASDKYGWYVIVSGRLYNTLVVLVNVYAPNVDDAEFFKRLFSLLSDLNTNHLILEGTLIAG